MRTVGALDRPRPVHRLRLRSLRAEAYVKGGFHDHVLVIGAEVQSTGLDFSTKGRDVAVIFGDGAGAVVVGPAEAGEGDPLLPPSFRGKLRQGAVGRRPQFHRQPLDHPRDDRRRENIFPKMNGRYVFTHAVRRFPEVHGGGPRKEPASPSRISPC